MKFNFEATGIGSLPFKEAGRACRLIFDNFRSIPFWPQLPKRSFRESMYCQFSEGIPGIVIDEKAKTIYLDSKKCTSEMEKAYQRYLDNDTEYFRISEGHAEGFYAFCDGVSNGAKDARFVKGHITGPVSFALSVTDENKKAVIYDKGLFDVVTKALCMKAQWQIRQLRDLDKQVIIFIDEPYLVSIGSSFVNIPAEAVAGALDEINSAIREEGALSGIHCCGNTDWPMLLKRGIDIINFDAYNFTKEFSLYSDDIKQFVLNEGTIAWGIVPSSEAVENESAGSVVRKLESGVKVLSDKGINVKGLSSIITPSCGLGTLDENSAEKIIKLTGSVSQSLRNK